MVVQQSESDQKLAFSVYVAALDREEQAATGYQRARTGRDGVGSGLTQLRCSVPGELDAGALRPSASRVGAEVKVGGRPCRCGDGDRGRL